MMGALTTQRIPVKLQGKLISLCFELILSSSEPVAVKVLSLEMLDKLRAQHPELKNEIKATIEDQMPKTSMAFRSRSNKILRSL